MNDIILEIQDMQYLDWNLRKMSSGTPGCFASIILLVNSTFTFHTLTLFNIV